MTDTDLEQIQHLDFDIDEEGAKPCVGYLLTNSVTREIMGVKRKCQNPAVLVVTWSCCGRRRAHKCLECYNATCRLFTENVIRLKHKQCGSVIHGFPYLPDLEWL